MELNHWKRVTENGVACVEHDGDLIGLEELIRRPTFWTEHIGDKIWGTQPVVAELAAIAAAQAGGTL